MMRFRLWVLPSSMAIALLVGCGSATNLGSAPTDTPTQSAPSDEHRGHPCDLGAALSGATRVLELGSLSLGAEIRVSTGDLYQRINLDPAQLATNSTGPSDRPVLLSTLTEFVTTADREALVQAGGLALVLTNGRVSPDLDASVVVMAFSETATRGLSLVGPCAAQWDQAIKDGASSLGEEVTPEFVMRLSKWGNRESIAVTDAVRSHPPAADWLALNPADRSLDYKDIPADVSGQFALTGLYLPPIPDDGGPLEGFARLRSSEGILITFELAGVQGVVPVMVPLHGAEVWLEFSDSPTTWKALQRVELGSLDSSTAVDAGLELKLQREGLSWTASLRVLTPGELAKILGVSPDDLSRLRESLLRSAVAER